MVYIKISIKTYFWQNIDGGKNWYFFIIMIWSNKIKNWIKKDCQMKLKRVEIMS
jgi:hypothetical protein